MGGTNCWDFKNCGQNKAGGCSAFTEGAGRACWLVAGTMCGGKVQGTAAQKIGNCRDCDFYQKVKAHLV